MALFQIQVSILQGIGKVYIVAVYSILGIVAKYIINYNLIAIPSINIYGALIGNLIGFLVPVILNSIYIKIYLKFKIKVVSYIISSIISSIAMGLASYLLYAALRLIHIIKFVRSLIVKALEYIKTRAFLFNLKFVITR